VRHRHHGVVLAVVNEDRHLDRQSGGEIGTGFHLIALPAARTDEWRRDQGDRTQVPDPRRPRG
jgi:hypothetical protein